MQGAGWDSCRRGVERQSRERLWIRTRKRKQGAWCECSGVEEHRTGGRSGRRRSERSTLPRYCVSRSLWSTLSCDEILTRGRNRMGPGSHAAGGGAPGWRPRPFGLVGAGSGVGVGRRGDYLRSKKKNSIEHSVPGLIRSSCDRVWQTARGGLLPLQNSRLHTQSP